MHVGFAPTPSSLVAVELIAVALGGGVVPTRILLVMDSATCAFTSLSLASLSRLVSSFCPPNSTLISWTLALAKSNASIAVSFVANTAMVLLPPMPGKQTDTIYLSSLRRTPAGRSLSFFFVFVVVLMPVAFFLLGAKDFLVASCYL